LPLAGGSHAGAHGGRVFPRRRPAQLAEAHGILDALSERVIKLGRERAALDLLPEGAANHEIETFVQSLFVKGRLTPLEEKYAKLLLDHRTLKQQSSKIPGNVTEIAREHQRLLKDLADTHYNMGVNFAKRKDYPRAAIEFRKTIELRPDDADAHYNLGVIYAEHVPDRERALTFFRKYLTIKPRGESANWAKHYIATWQAWEGKERLE